MARSAISIAANTVEGFSGTLPKDFCRFLGISKGSLAELEHYIYLSNRRNLLLEKEYSHLSALAEIRDRRFMVSRMPFPLIVGVHQR